MAAPYSEASGVLGDVVDAVLADRTLGGAAKDVCPVGFAPGEIKFKDKLFYGGRVVFQAEGWH